MSPYWVYYEKTSPKEVKNGPKAKSLRGSIGETWWSKRWVGVLESFDLGARMTRGRSYARKGRSSPSMSSRELCGLVSRAHFQSHMMYL